MCGFSPCVTKVLNEKSRRDNKSDEDNDDSDDDEFTKVNVNQRSTCVQNSAIKVTI